MGTDDDFFGKMCKEAINEVASGEKGWREAESNTLILACFGMLTNHLTSRIVKPLWFFASTAFVGVVGFIVTKVMSSGG